MFAIVRTGGKQYKVAPGDVFEVERLKIDIAFLESKVVLDQVLLVDDGDECTVGNPTIEGAGVECTVVNAIRGPKIRVFKFKAKKRYRRMQGHRQELTVLRVDDVRTNPWTAAGSSEGRGGSQGKGGGRSQDQGRREVGGIVGGRNRYTASSEPSGPLRVERGWSSS